MNGTNQIQNQAVHLKKTNTDSVQIQGVVNRFMKALLSVLMLPKRHLKTKQDINKACLLIL